MNRAVPLSLAILISGRGTNMAAIARACRDRRINAEIACVIADRADAGGLILARELGLESQSVPARELPDRAAFESALIQSIDAAGAQLVVLAGFMRVLSASFVQHYAGRLLNIHPSLLPQYKGLHTHRRVLAAGDPVHGVSIHFVTEDLDGGPIILQARIPVLPGDTEATLSARIQVEEHRMYPEVVGLFADGRVRLVGDNIELDGTVLAAPLEEILPHANADIRT